MMLNDKENRLYDLMNVMNPDMSLIESYIVKENLTADEVTRAAINYVDNCYEEEEITFYEEDWPWEPVLRKDLKSCFIPEITRLLLKHGLKPFTEYKDDCVTSFADRLRNISNEYISSDVLYELLEIEPDIDCSVNGERVFDGIDYDILFGKNNQENRRMYDAWVHFWFVWIGFGALTDIGKKPVEIVDNGYDDIFTLDQLKNHREFSFCLSLIPHGKDGWSMHIFRRSTMWEVARL